MQEKFSFKSGWYYLFFVAVMVGTLFVMVIAIFGAAQMEDPYGVVFALLFLFLWPALGGVGGWLLGNVPCRYEADETSVTFRVFFMTTQIRYADIDSMELSREHFEVILRGDVPHYEETLKIVLKDGTEHSFQSKLELDTDEIARHPEKAAEQFEKGKLRRLQLYIESHRKGES